MRGGERRVKWLDAERRHVFGETIGGHQGHRAEPPNVAVVERPAVVEREFDRRVAALVLRKSAAVDEQRAGEPRLHDDAVARRQVEHDELGAAPAARDRRAGRAAGRIRAARALAQHVALDDDDADDRATGDLAIEIARDRLGFR